LGRAPTRLIDLKLIPAPTPVLRSISVHFLGGALT